MTEARIRFLEAECDALKKENTSHWVVRGEYRKERDALKAQVEAYRRYASLEQARDDERAALKARVAKLETKLAGHHDRGFMGCSDCSLGEGGGSESDDATREHGASSVMPRDTAAADPAAPLRECPRCGWSPSITKNAGPWAKPGVKA